MKIQKYRPTVSERRMKLENQRKAQVEKIKRFNRDFASKFPNLWFKSVHDWKEQIERENKELARIDKALKRLELPDPPQRPKQLKMFT